MKTIEERVQILEANFASLQEAFLTSQTNNAESQGQIDNTTNAVEQITPTSYTKTAYIGDTEVVFTDVVNGNLTVYVTDNEGNTPTYTVTQAEYIKVAFSEPLTSVATVTISIV